MINVLSVSGYTLSYSSQHESVNDVAFCPISHSKGKRLLQKTMANHVKPQYWPLLSEKGFYFCHDRDCPIVYFNTTTQIYFGINDLRAPVMHKLAIGTTNKPMCYCKNVLEKQVIDELLVKKCCDSLQDIKAYTDANTGKDCAITNPSGRCCGDEIKYVLEWAKTQRVDTILLSEAESCCPAEDPELEP